MSTENNEKLCAQDAGSVLSREEYINTFKRLVEDSKLLESFLRGEKVSFDNCNMSIEALPVYAGTAKLVEKLADELQKEYERAEQISAFDAQLRLLPWTDFNVMVGSVRNDAQLVANLKDRFYYAPAKYIPEDKLNIKYIALFQAAGKFFSGINYYGEVSTVKRVKRSEIPVAPSRNNGDEEYYLYTVKDWNVINTVNADTDSVREPRYTNLFLLEHAKSVYELFCINSPKEYRLLYWLKRCLASPSKERQGLLELGGGYALNIDKDGFTVLGADGKEISRYTAKSFKYSPKNTFIGLKRDIGWTDED